MPTTCTCKEKIAKSKRIRKLDRKSFLTREIGIFLENLIVTWITFVEIVSPKFSNFIFCISDRSLSIWKVFLNRDIDIDIMKHKKYDLISLYFNNGT